MNDKEAVRKKVLLYRQVVTVALGVTHVHKSLSLHWQL